MHVELPGDVGDFVKNLVMQGRFDSEAAAVVEGIRLLMSREKLCKEIQQAVDQIDRGEWQNEESLFKDLDAEIDRIESSQRGS